MNNISTREKLISAMRLNQPETFREILEKEGWPKDEEFSNYDLIMKAISYKCKPIVHILLDKNCRVMIAKSGTTPLHLAVTMTGWSDVIERLLKRGCRIGNRLSRGNTDTALHLAFRHHAPDYIIDQMLDIYLRQESAANLASKDGLNFLHIACTRPNVCVVQKFTDELDDNAFIDLTTFPSNYTSLHYAVKYEQIEVTEFLLKRGANLNKQDQYGSTPLHIALGMRNTSMIDLLLRYNKSRENIVDKFGLSHFMVACAGSKFNIVKECLESETSPSNLINSQVKNVGSYAAYTPLHFAADFGRIETIELLLNYGADCCAITFHELTVHTLAKQRNHEAVCDLLREHCDVLTKCRELRAESPDFEKWGGNYEAAVLIERTRTLKGLRKTLRSLTAISCSSDVMTRW